MFSSIKTRLLVPVCLIILLLTAGIVIQIYSTTQDSLYRGKTELMQQEFNQVKLLLEEQAETAYSLAAWVAQSPSAVEAFAARDREKLQALLLPVFEKLKIDLNLS